MYVADSFFDSLRPWGNCFLTEARYIPDADSLIKRYRNYQILAWMKASTHNVVIMASEDTIDQEIKHYKLQTTRYQDFRHSGYHKNQIE
jgi:hypothetical protein